MLKASAYEGTDIVLKDTYLYTHMYVCVYTYACADIYLCVNV